MIYLLMTLAAVISVFISLFTYDPTLFGYTTLKEFRRVLEAEKSLREGLLMDLKRVRNELEAKRQILAQYENPINVERKKSQWVIVGEDSAKELPKRTKKGTKKSTTMRKSKK